MVVFHESSCTVAVEVEELGIREVCVVAFVVSQVDHNRGEIIAVARSWISPNNFYERILWDKLFRDWFASAKGRSAVAFVKGDCRNFHAPTVT